MADVQINADRIGVKFGRLTEKPVCHVHDKGITLGKFLAAHNIRFSDAIRVNNKRVNLEHVLQNQDLVTQIDEISGGRE